MSNFTGPHGGIGVGSWERAAEEGYKPSQIKTAIQQLHQHTGISVGSGVQEKHMQKHKGYAHGINRFQGVHGNLGQSSYEAARDAGYNIEDIPMLAAQGGMFLPEGAQKQWQMDMMEKYTPVLEEPVFEMPGTHMGGGKVLGTSAMGVRSALSSQDNTGGTQEAFGRDKKKKKTDYAAQLRVNPLG